MLEGAILSQSIVIMLYRLMLREMDYDEDDDDDVLCPFQHYLSHQNDGWVIVKTSV